MYKKLIICLSILFANFLFVSKINAKTANIYLFYGDGCPHCKAAESYFDSINDKYDIKLYKYEVWYNDNNKQLMSDVAKKLDFNVKGVPFVIIDNTPINGFSSGKTEQTYDYHIKMAQKETFKDDIGIYLGVVEEVTTHIKTTTKTTQLNNDKVIDSVVSFGFKNSISYCYIGLFIIIIAILMVINNKKSFIKVICSYFVISNLLQIIMIDLNISYERLVYFGFVARFSIALVLLVMVILNLIGFLKYITKNDDVEKSKTGLETFGFSLVIIILSLSIKLLELSCVSENMTIITSLLNELRVDHIVKMIYIIIYIITTLLDDFAIFGLLYFIFNKLGLFVKEYKYRYLISAIILLLICTIIIIKPSLLIYVF